MQFKYEVEVGKNLKVTRIVAQKLGSKTIWVFQHSVYQIHIVDISAPYPHHKISLQHPLQHFDVIQSPNHSCILIVNSVGAWVAYDVQVEPKSKSLVISQVSQSVLENIQHRVIGVHLIHQDNKMILFVKDSGILEYNYLTSPMRANKVYSTEPENQKYRNSNLFSNYRGRSLLETETDNQNRILHSVFSLLTNELYVVTEDLSSKVCSIMKFLLQDYQVIAGSDFLLNLGSRPLQILLIDRIAVVNLGKSMVVWTRNLAELEKYGEEGLCTSLTQLDNNSMMACMSKINQSCIYLISIQGNPKQAKPLCTIKHQKLHTIPQQILHYSAVEPQKMHPAVWVTNKLEIMGVDKDNSVRVILPNLSASILHAKMYSSSYCNYLDVVKKLGYEVQRKIVTNNRIVVGVDEYQHNMLIKMGTIVGYGLKGQNAILCLTSPIIGTIKLSVSFNGEGGRKQKISQSSIVLSTSNMQSNLSTQQQSLYLNSDKNQQITPTKLSLAKSRYSISDMFEGKIDFILQACIVGNYALMAVEKQVHVFIIDPKPKRLHIYCLDAQLRGLISINDVNVWGALLWDGSLLVLRIDEKQSVKIKQIPYVGLANVSSYLQYSCVINTAPFRSTILGRYLLICSNDPLHVYQSDKTSIRHLDLPCLLLGQQYYPLIQIQPKLNSAQKYKILCKKENMLAIVSFPLKCLVKEIDQIKMEVEMIVGLPTVDGLIACFIRENTILLLSGSRIVICGLQTGSITYQTMPTFQSLLPPSVSVGKNEYLRRWVEKQHVSVESLRLEGEDHILWTNPSIIKLNQSRILIYNRKQIWYASLASDQTNKLKTVKLISYFSIPNDAFLQFRNNLSISELENDAFMEMFAEKLPILEVSMIKETLFAVLYSRMIVVVEITNNGAMAIQQQLLLSAYPEIIAIKHFVGVYDELSLYLKDTSQRLILMRWNKQSNKYTLEVLEEVEDQVICIFKVHGWKENIRRIGFKRDEQVNYQQIMVKKDGQLIKTGQTNQIYL